MSQGTYDPANLEGDGETIFEDIIVDGTMYLNPQQSLGYTAPLIQSVYDVGANANLMNFSLPQNTDEFRFCQGISVNSYAPYLSITPNGLYCDAKTISYPEIGCLDGVNAPIQTQINNILTGTGYWGGFWSTSTQTNPTANTINLVTYTDADPSNNQVSYSNSSRINFTNKGTYLIVASFQLSKASGSTEEAIYFFLRKNAVDIPASGYKEFIKTTPKILTSSWIVDASANDYVEVAWWSSDIHAQLEFIPAGTGTPVYPSSPSALVQVSAVSRIAGATSATNPVLNYMSLFDNGTTSIVSVNSTSFNFGNSLAPSNAYSVCRGNFLMQKNGSDFVIQAGRIRSTNSSYTNELRNLTCAGSVSLYDTTSTYRFVGAGTNNLTGVCQFGTYGNNNITCLSNFIKRLNDQYSIYVKTGDVKIEAGNLYPNVITWNTDNNWDGVTLKTNNIICNQTLTTASMDISGNFSVVGDTTLGDSISDIIILNGKIDYMTGTGSPSITTSIYARGGIRSDLEIIGSALVAGTYPNQVSISYSNTTLNNLQTTGSNYFYGSIFTIDDPSSITLIKGDVRFGNSSTNQINATGNFVNRGDGYAIYTSSGGIRAAGDITTPNDLWCNCYSVGGVNYGYYKLIDFINARDQVCYDRGTEGVNKANDAYDLAATAQATATATAAAVAAQAVVVAGLATDVTALNATTAAQTAAIGSLTTRTTALEDKTLNMLPASIGYASHFLNHVQIYQASNPYDPVIDLDPTGLSTIGGGVKTPQIRHTSDNTKLDVTFGINTGDITCDEIGSNKITNSGETSTATLKTNTIASTTASTKVDITYGVSTGDISCNAITNTGNMQTGTLNSGSITATTGTHQIDGSSVSIGSYSTPVYINGLLYIPWNPIGYLYQYT
jgi:hypothetical protein